MGSSASKKNNQVPEHNLRVARHKTPKPTNRRQTHQEILERKLLKESGGALLVDATHVFATQARVSTAKRRWSRAMKTITKALSNDKHMLIYDNYDHKRIFKALSKDEDPDQLRTDIRDDRIMLLESVDGIYPVAPGQSFSPRVSCLTATLPLAFPLVCDGQDHPVVAAARAGKGRVVAFGHLGFLTNDGVHYPTDHGHNQFGTRALVKNAIRWVAKVPATKRITVCCETCGTTRKFQNYGCECIAGVRAEDAAGVVDILVITANQMTLETLLAARKHLAYGKGVIIAGSGIEWAFKRSIDLRNMPANLLLAPYGITYTAEPAEPSTDLRDPVLLFKPDYERLQRCCVAGSVMYLIENLMSPETNKEQFLSPSFKRAYLHACMAIESFPQPCILAQLITSNRALMDKLGTRTAVNTSLESIADRACVLLKFLAERHAAAGGAQETPASPRGLLSISKISLTADQAPPADIPATSNAAPPSGSLVSESRIINTWNRGLHGTGLYALPGQPVTVRITGTCTYGIACVIGHEIEKLWSPNLGADTWMRDPEGTSVTNLTDRQSEYVTITDHNGGLVFIEASGSVLQTKVSAPKGLSGFGIFLQAVISNCVRAPLFRMDDTKFGVPTYHGTTTLDEYKESLNCDPQVKYGMLVGRRLSLTLPADVLKTIEDPEEVTGFWDDAIDLFEDLVHRAHVDCHNLIHIVVDRQDGVEFLRKDPYVIAVRERLAGKIVDITALKTTDFKTFWGILSHLAEIFESNVWPRMSDPETWSHLLSMYVAENLLGVELSQLVQRVGRMHARPIDIVMRPCSTVRMRHVQSDRPKVSQAMLHLLINTFGWKIFRKVFQRYSRLEKWQLPVNARDRMDTFVCLVSVTVQRDMMAFFALWGMHVSSSEVLNPWVADELANLPRWMPNFDFDPALLLEDDGHTVYESFMERRSRRQTRMQIRQNEFNTACADFESKVSTESIAEALSGLGH